MMKRRMDFIISIIAAVAMLISFIIIEISFKTAQGWFDDEAVNGMIVVLAVTAVGLLVGYGAITFSGFKAGNNAMKIVKEVMAAGGAACMGILAGLTIGAIATEFAYTFLSDFNKGTAKMEFMPTACIQAGIGIILAIVSILIVTLNGAVKED